jgi:hypothetical protein
MIKQKQAAFIEKKINVQACCLDVFKSLFYERRENYVQEDVISSMCPGVDSGKQRGRCDILG